MNGDLTINGGNVTISAQSPFDYDGQGSLTGGTVTVNGEKVTELANSMMGGGMMSQGGGAMGQRMPRGMQGQRGSMPQDGAPQA